MAEIAMFWYVEALLDGGPLSLAVSAFTERSARMQARKALGALATIDRITPVNYAHAWVVDHRSPRVVVEARR